MIESKRAITACVLACVIGLGFGADVASGAEVKVGQVTSQSGITHSFLATGKETYILGGDGRIKWSYPASTRDGFVLPNGNILLTLTRQRQKGARYPGGGVIEVERSGKIVFEYIGKQSEVNTAQRLPNGNTLVVEAGDKPRILEVNPRGKVVVDVPMQCQTENHHMESRMTRKMSNGNYLAPQLHDFAVKEYTPTGKVVRVIKTDRVDPEVHTWPFTAIRLANGNTLIGLTHGNEVIEVAPNGKVVWRLTNQDCGDIIRDACGVQRLPNGNTVITSYAGRQGVKLFEVTPDKEVVWSYADGKTHGIHHFQILDTNGVPLVGAPMK
ncbi:MAG: beta-propeller domain-containing protein [Planctomycetota bacterium]|jgi:hypothetical protein